MEFVGSKQIQPRIHNLRLVLMHYINNGPNRTHRTDKRVLGTEAREAPQNRGRRRWGGLVTFEGEGRGSRGGDSRARAAKRRS